MPIKQRSFLKLQKNFLTENQHDINESLSPTTSLGRIDEEWNRAHWKDDPFFEVSIRHPFIGNSTIHIDFSFGISSRSVFALELNSLDFWSATIQMY